MKKQAAQLNAKIRDKKLLLKTKTTFLVQEPVLDMERGKRGEQEEGLAEITALQSGKGSNIKEFS